MRRLLAPTSLLALAGCATSFGRLGVVSPDPDAIGVKLLRPGVEGRSCRASVLGVPLGRGAPELHEALAHILALDAEGNVVTHAQVTWRHFVTGLYNRRCLEVRGDLGRTVSTLTLPTPMSHPEHGSP